MAQKKKTKKKLVKRAKQVKRPSRKAAPQSQASSSVETPASMETKPAIELGELAAKTQLEKPSAKDENLDKIIDYLENTILPRARGSSFSGSVPLLVDGKFTVRNVSSVSELETLIKELKAAKVQLMATELPKTNLPSPTQTATSVPPVAQSKSAEKRAGFLGKLTAIFSK